MRRLPNPVVFFVLAFAALCGRSLAAPPPIVLVSIDTLRSDRLPAYGYAGVKTPAIDALRRDGVLFERAYTPVPLTLPSHATILTGLLPPQHGVRDNIGYRLETDGSYLPQLLRGHGYATAGAVSAFVLRGAGGLAEGFDLYDDAIEERPRAGVGGLQRSGTETLARVLPWLRQRGGEPFFLFFHVFEPHTPYEPPEPFASRYPSPYDGEVAAADQVVGKLLDELRRLGLYDRAAVVLVSDHGEGLGDHGEDEHGVLLYRESLQVPLILKLPGGRHAGKTVEAPVGLADVYPTLLALAGIGPPSDLPGVSLVSLVDDDAPQRALYAETFFPRLHFGWSGLTSLVEGRFHFIQGPDPELYDLVADPGETKNVLREEREVASRLHAALRELKGELAAPAEADPEARRALAALGYVSTRDDGEDLPDPKTRLATVEDLKEGLRLYALGELEGAAAACRRAVEKNPGSLDAWEYLGRSLSELGRRDEALLALDRALELADGKASHLAVAATLTHLNAGRATEALALVRREIPRSLGALTLRLLEARALVILGRLDEALKSVETAVEHAPENADAVYLRGAVRIGRRELAAAESDLRRALELAPAHTAAMSDLAVLLQLSPPSPQGALQHQGRLDEARELLRRVLELRPGDALAARNLRNLEAAMAGGGG